ncbi:MAG: SMC family ATPase [Acidobacteria bacterium]|nr:SMC family ATPase [Acidobacteriota bacterium]
MPNLPHSPLPSTSELRAYLQRELPDSRLSEVTVAPSYNPLLLLRTDHSLAAFGFANGDARKSYESIYAGFKKYYAAQREQWDSLDLAFVFCVNPDLPHLDQFCSSIETDVYFCRKFVIPLSGLVGMSLARLPFLPLTPLTGQSLRPPSAQTFLRQCGVPADLAKFLVVQRARGPEAIVEDCIKGDFGDPIELTPTHHALIAHPDQVAEPITLESVTIENFRAYRRSKTFTLGSDVTVLYGANGFGKTSFFDAFDFATTGEIGRIPSRGEEHFKKYATHLDSRPEDSSVSLSFKAKNKVHRLTRSVYDRRHASLDGTRIDRKSLLSELTSGEFPPTDRVENFVSLFRATHLFNQELPELTKDFQDDCRLPSEIVARMLAFEDYASAVSKSSRVQEHLKNVIASADAQIMQLSRQITEATSELNRLSSTTVKSTPSESLEGELLALAKKLGDVGLSIGPEKVDVSVLRGWRASLEGRLAESHSRSDRLSALAEEIGDITRTRFEVSRLQRLIAEKDQLLGEAEARHVTADSLLKRAEQRALELRRAVAAGQTQIDLLKWIRLKRPQYNQLIQGEREANDMLARATSKMIQDRITEESIAGELLRLDEVTPQRSKELQIAREQLALAGRVSESIAGWRAKLARLKVVIQLEGEAAKSFEALGTEAQGLASRVASFTAEEARIARSIAEVDKSQSELKRLASQLAGLVQTGTCPLCGQYHGSRDELLKRIEHHLSLDVASGIRASLTEVRDRIRGVSQEITQNTERYRIVEGLIGDLQTEHRQLEWDIGQFKESGGKLGIVLDANSEAPTKQLQTLSNRIQVEIGDLERQIKEATISADALRLKLRNVRAGLAASTAESREQTARLNRIGSEIAELRSDPRAIQVPLDSEDQHLTELEAVADGQLSELRSNAETMQAEIVKKKSEVAAINQESTALKAQRSELRVQLTGLQKVDADVTARLNQETLPPDAGQELLRIRIAEESQLQARLAALRDSTSNLELALDSATTSAVLAQLRNNAREKERSLSAVSARKDRLQLWFNYFIEISRLVSTKQGEAIASFTREYGPRTSVIQRRLRSVYGFDEVDIRSQNSEIRVRVRRHGEELRPTDYFSQSQQQTLFLGLFLTACISQTWSAFSPVFLDDPVTHFDDLNTYAFLDLVVGLLVPSPWKRQFVISTCDEKFLQLARQKFRHLGNRAAFYRFSSIGVDGPTTEESFTL